MMSNLLVVLFLTLLFGFLLIFFIQKTTKKKPSQALENLDPILHGLNFDQFYLISCNLLEKLGLVIKDSYRDSDREADIMAENPTPLVGGPIITHLHLYPDEGKVTSMDVMNFSSNLVGDRRGKGIYITTGEFAPEVWTLPELHPMEFIDGKKLAQLLQEHGLELKSEDPATDK